MITTRHGTNDTKLVVIASYAPSLLNFRGDLLRAIRERKWDVHALAPDIDPATRARLAEMGVASTSIPLDRSGLDPAQDLETIAALRRLLVRIAPKVLFTYTPKPVIYGGIAGQMASIPHIVSMITGLGSLFAYTGGIDRLTRPIVNCAYRTALRHCGAVVFQNRDDRDMFLERHLVSADRCELVAGSGVNLDHFRPSPLPKGEVRFLMVARLLVEKGVREYARAASILKARGVPASFDLVGPVEEHPRAIGRQEVREWETKGVLTWHGPLDDVRQALRDCTVYVLPSYREGTPRSTLEALSTGRPVLTTEAPGCRETVEEGRNGFSIPVRDALALADAMQRCVVERARLDEMGRASLRLAHEKFDVNKVNRDLMRILRIA